MRTLALILVVLVAMACLLSGDAAEDKEARDVLLQEIMRFQPLRLKQAISPYDTRDKKGNVVIREVHLGTFRIKNMNTGTAVGWLWRVQPNPSLYEEHWVLDEANWPYPGAANANAKLDFLFQGEIHATMDQFLTWLRAEQEVRTQEGAKLRMHTHAVSALGDVPITTHPQDVTVAAPAPAPFSVLANPPTGVVEYQWQRKVGLNYEDLAEGTGGHSNVKTPNLSVGAPVNGDRYRCALIWSDGPSKSTTFTSSAMVTVTP
jgi:hypothetical protein